MRNQMSGCVLVGDHLYGFDDKVFKCLSLAGETAWEERGTGNGAVLGTTDRLVFLTGDGELVVAAANPERFEEPLAGRPLRGRQRLLDHAGPLERPDLLPQQPGHPGLPRPPGSGRGPDGVAGTQRAPSSATAPPVAAKAARCRRPRKNSTPSEAAGEDRHSSPSSLRPRTSNSVPVRTTYTAPSSLGKYRRPPAAMPEPGEAGAALAEALLVDQLARRRADNRTGRPRRCRSTRARRARSASACSCRRAGGSRASPASPPGPSSARRSRARRCSRSGPSARARW